MKQIIIAIFVLLFVVPFVLSEVEERNIFIIDSDGDVQFKYQIVAAVDDGYYLDPVDMPLTILENSTNLKFYDSYGTLPAKFDYNEDGYDQYTVISKTVEYNKPYQFGFTRDLPKYTTVRYKENYFFEYPLYLAKDSDALVYVCMPSSASRFATEYDSTPKDDWRLRNISFIKRDPIDYVPLTLTKLYDKTAEDQIKEVAICPKGYSAEEIYGVEKGVSTTINFDFSDYSNTVDTYTYQGNKISVQIPIIYKTKLLDNMPAIEEAVSSIPAILALKAPENYTLIFVSDNDKILEGGFMMSYEDGKVYMKTSLMRTESAGLIQVNILRGLINSALLNTYGISVDDSWWTSGALTNQALVIMKENNLPISEVQSLLNDVKDVFKLLTINEVAEVMNNPDTEYRANIDSSIVDEIDMICPNHVIKLNKVTLTMTGLNFSNDREFNNYILFNIRNDCSRDAGEILDKYQLPHDNVKQTSTKYDLLNEKFSSININRDDIVELNTLRSHLTTAENLLKIGKVAEANSLIDDSQNLYDTKLRPLIQILTDYSAAEKNSDSIPLIFALPAKSIASSNLDKAIIAIKDGDLELAKSSINKSLFWSNNAIILALLLYVIIGISGWFGYQKYSKKPKHNKHKRDE